MELKVVLVLALAASVSSRILVNETVYIQASVNITKQKQYLVNATSNEGVDIKDIISQLYEKIRGVNSLKPEVQEVASPSSSKASTEIAIPTTPDPLQYDSTGHHHKSTDYPSVSYKLFNESIQSSTHIKNLKYSEDSSTGHNLEDLPGYTSNEAGLTSLKPEVQEVTSPPSSKASTEIAIPTTLDSLQYDSTGYPSVSSKVFNESIQSSTHINNIKSSEDSSTGHDLEDLPGYTSNTEGLTSLKPDVQEDTSAFSFKASTETAIPATLDSLQYDSTGHHHASTGYPSVSSKVFNESIISSTHISNIKSSEDSSTGHNLEDLPGYTSQNEVHAKENTKSPVPEKGNHSSTEDQLHEATISHKTSKMSVNATQTATFSPEHDNEQQVNFTVSGNQTHHIEEIEPTRNASFPQDTGFLESDLSTPPQTNTTSGIDQSSQVKEISVSDSKGLAPTVDSLTLQTSTYKPASPKTSLSDQGSNHTAGTFSSDPPTNDNLFETDIILQSKLTPESHSNDFTSNTVNWTHTTMATLSLQETNTSKSGLQHSQHATDSVTPFQSSESDAHHINDSLSHSTSAVRDENATHSDANSTNSTSLYAIYNCTGRTRLIPLVTDPKEVKIKPIDANQLYSTTRFPFDNSKGQSQYESQDESSSTTSSAEHSSLDETYDSLVQHSLRPEWSATQSSSEGVGPSESTVLSSASHDLKSSSPTAQQDNTTESSSFYNTDHILQSDQRDPTVQPTSSHSPEDDSMEAHNGSKGEHSVSDQDNSSQWSSQHDTEVESHSTKSFSIDPDDNFGSVHVSPTGDELKDNDGPKDIHKDHVEDQDMQNLFDPMDLQDNRTFSSTSSIEDINLKTLQVDEKGFYPSLSEDTNQSKGSEKPFSQNSMDLGKESNVTSRVKRGELPFVVSLQEKSGYHFCCGSILSSTWILTTAHCFRPEWRRDAKNLQVVAGAHEFPSIDNDTQIIEVAEIIWHESFLIDDPGYFNDDIAVLKLTYEVEFSDVVGISTLSMDRDWSQQYKVILCLSSFYPSEMIQIEMGSLLEDECRTKLGQDYFEDFVCLQDFLEDSGGPVIVDGLQTGLAINPNLRMTGFVRIASYFEWIQNTTGYLLPKLAPIGKSAEKGEFPFVVMVQTRDRTHFCTATIVHPDWVLAPRHCLREGEDLSNYVVLAGLTRFLDAYISTRHISDTKLQQEGHRHGRQRFMLLKMDRSFKIKATIQPCRLPKDDHQIHFGEPIQIIGWQNVLLGASITQHLHYINASLLSPEECVHKTGADNDFLCADPKKPILKGMMSSVAVQNGAVVGVSAEDQSQFTKIQSMLEWIRSVIN